MESNDRLNWGDDSEIEKIIPLDRGINNFSLTYNLEPLLFIILVQTFTNGKLMFKILVAYSQQSKVSQDSHLSKTK